MFPAGINSHIKEENFASLTALWQKYGRELGWQTLFVLPPWLETWWETFQPEGELYLRSVWKNDHPCGVAPLYIRDGTAFFVGGEDVCDYQDFPVAAGKEELFFAALFEDLRKKGVEQLKLGLVRSDAAAQQGFSCLDSPGGSRPARQEKDVSFEMELPPDWEEYLKTLSKKQRHEVRRKLRRLHEGAEVCYRELPGQDLTPEVLQVFFDLFARSREDKAAFLTPLRETFFRRLVEKTSRADLLRVGVLELNARPAAMTMHFVYEGRVYLYNSGHDPGYRTLSPGLMAKVFCIQESIRQQRRVFDFLKGREIFKSRLGGKEIPLYSWEAKID